MFYCIVIYSHVFLFKIFLLYVYFYVYMSFDFIYIYLYLKEIFLIFSYTLFLKVCFYFSFINICMYFMIFFSLSRLCLCAMPLCVLVLLWWLDSDWRCRRVPKAAGRRLQESLSALGTEW